MQSGWTPYLDVLGELLESLEDLGEGEEADLVGEVGLVLVDLGADGFGHRLLDLGDLDDLGEGVLVGAEDLDDLAGGLLGGGGQLGDSGAGLLGWLPYLDVLGESVELVLVVVNGGGGSEVVEGSDSQTESELLLVGEDLATDFGGERLLEGSDLVQLLTGKLVGAEDLEDISGGLLGGGRELEHAGLGLLGVGLQCTYLDDLSEDLESGDDLGEGEDADLVGELGLVGLDLGLDGGGEGLLQLVDLDDLSERVLVGAEDLDDLAGGSLGGGRELGNSGAGLLGTVELVEVVVVGVSVVEVVEGHDSQGESFLDLLDSLVLLEGSLVGDEDVDDLAGGSLGGGRELGNSGAGLLGARVEGMVPYLDVVGEFLQSLDDLGDGQEADLVGELSLVVVDLSNDGGGEVGLNGLALLVLGLRVLVRDEDLDDLSGGLLGRGRELGDTGAGLLGFLESLEDLGQSEDADLVGDVGLEVKINNLDVLGQFVHSVHIGVMRGSVAEMVDGCDADLLRDLLLEGVDLSEHLNTISINSIDPSLHSSSSGSVGSDSLIFLHSSNFSFGVLSETKILTMSPNGFWAAGDRVATLARASSGCAFKVPFRMQCYRNGVPHLDVVSQLLESLENLGQGEDSNTVSELGLVVLDLGTDGGRELGLDLLCLVQLRGGVLVGEEDLDDLAGGSLGGSGQLVDACAHLMWVGLSMNELCSAEDLDDLAGRSLSGGRELGNTGASLLGAHSDVLGELLQSRNDLMQSKKSDLVGQLGLTFELVSVLVSDRVVTDMVDGGESQLLGELLLVGENLSEHLGESILDLSDLHVLLAGSLVGAENLEYVAGGLLGGGRELEHAGASFLGPYLDMRGEQIESSDDLLQSKKANLVSELRLVVLDLGSDWG
ncbi:hypothetical protein PRIPAC_73154 [Pristionchus pacificus]|uniref:Uncharacterized protein n=1 Tax=Pristionchus pacificus TaxID=54126 RepID=A0A2A6C7K0_PRIPA|nr:hypothetical protein PRIPAC_73154 [Pristionchus pacificus]|eukprot:PDM74076.1 hypothetical protein PRIPAC_41432 [Pristionchus pacificus]